MKVLFVTILSVLALASLFTWWNQPETLSEHPVIYWVTDPNPAREEQIRLFQEWLEKNDYPKMNLRLDTANNRIEKKLIQGVSGVAGDILDTGEGGAMRYLQNMGLLRDITRPALEMGFDPSHTYASIAPEITVEGRQYAFPCNVSARLLWVNLETFRDAGLGPPPMEWDWDTFEEWGRRYVEAANPSGGRVTHFFVNNVDSDQMRRSLGLDALNETLSACKLDDPRNVRVLERIRKWREVDRILPTADDEASFATDSSYGGMAIQLFNSGVYAMMSSGRYALIQLRNFGNLDLAVSQPPYAEYPNTSVRSRAATLYTASGNPELAYYFFKFLASEEYNMQIVRDGDALPPDPAFAQTEEFLTPPDHPNEWGLHERFAEATETIGIGGSYSPFVVPARMDRIVLDIETGFEAGIYDAEEAARLSADRVNQEIQRTLEEQPELRKDYERRLALQAKIDARRQRGEPVPREWIKNPFYQKYYQDMGWIE